MISRFNTTQACGRQTDRQTDRYTDRHVAIANTSLIRADKSPGLCNDHFVTLRSCEHSTVPVLSLGEPSTGQHRCGGTVVGP